MSSKQSLPGGVRLKWSLPWGEHLHVMHKKTGISQGRRVQQQSGEARVKWEESNWCFEAGNLQWEKKMG